ncbi:MAG: PadR family transcriptional regulator [Candidatus Limiplasma sp.]|nr:PadR family transcriptional regulator [Candidatus Limiplasma sp.]
MPDVLDILITELHRGASTLAVLSQLKSAKYGYALLQSLEEKGLPIEPGSLYPLLRRLESQGVLESRWDTTETRPRKYYMLSSYGADVLEKLKSQWQRLHESVDALL